MISSWRRSFQTCPQGRNFTKTAWMSWIWHIMTHLWTVVYAQSLTCCSNSARPLAKLRESSWTWQDSLTSATDAIWNWFGYLSTSGPALRHPSPAQPGAVVVVDSKCQNLSNLFILSHSASIVRMTSICWMNETDPFIAPHAIPETGELPICLQKCNRSASQWRCSSQAANCSSQGRCMVLPPLCLFQCHEF